MSISLLVITIFKNCNVRWLNYLHVYVTYGATNVKEHLHSIINLLVLLCSMSISFDFFVFPF